MMPAMIWNQRKIVGARTSYAPAPMACETIGPATQKRMAVRMKPQMIVPRQRVQWILQRR